MKLWSIEIVLLDQEGKDVEANLFSKVVYNLHPSFQNPTQSKSSIPASCACVAARANIHFQHSPTHHSAAKMRAGESST